MSAEWPPMFVEWPPYLWSGSHVGGVGLHSAMWMAPLAEAPLPTSRSWRLAALPPFLGMATLAAMPAVRSTGSARPWALPLAGAMMPRLLLLRLAALLPLSLPVPRSAMMVRPRGGLDGAGRRAP